MEKTSKIYIAGHRGLVGSAILRKLEAAGYENFVYRTHQELDLTRQECVEEFFDQERPDYVFLAAAKVGGIWANNTYPADFMYSNLAIQTHIIHTSYLYNVQKLLFLGSSCIYPKHCPQPMKEEYLLSGNLEPTNEPYAIAKIAGIKMCQSYNRQYGTHFISVMPTNLYGPNDNFDLETSHALPALVRKFYLAKLASKPKFGAVAQDEARFGPIPDDLKVSLGLPTQLTNSTNRTNLTNPTNRTNQPKVLLWGTGTPRREFLHVDDLADACLYLMNNYDESDIINIGTGDDLAIKELAKMIARIVEFEGGFHFNSSKPDGTPRKLLDVSKLYSLGWRPKISLESGIRETYNWYLRNFEKTKQVEQIEQINYPLSGRQRHPCRRG